MKNPTKEITIQLRVLYALLNEAEYNRPSIDSFQNYLLRIEQLKIDFERVDKIMNNIKEDDIFFYEDCDGGFEMNWFEQKVKSVKYPELGIIYCVEPNSSGKTIYERNISVMLTEEEFNIKFPQNTKLNENK